MKSFRSRLALLSVLISGMIIAGFGASGFVVLKSRLLKQLDLELAVPVDRISRELHPFTNFDRVFSNIELRYGDDFTEDRMRVAIRDGWNDEWKYQNPDSNWVSSCQNSLSDMPDYTKKMPPPRGHADGKAKGGKGKGKGKGPPPRPEFDSLTEIQYTHFTDDEGGKWRLGWQSSHGYTVVMAKDLSYYHTELRNLFKGLILAALTCLAIAWAGGWFVAQKAMEPMIDITQTAESITAQALDERIPIRSGEYQEFVDLIDVLNGMMERLEKGFGHANRFSSDVSHELKTPITIMQAELKSALSECEPGSNTESSLESISREAHRLKAITGSLMLLSQAESGRLAVKSERLNLSADVEDLVEDAEILCELAELKLEAEITPSIWIESDQTLLHQALLNLVSNAVKYNQENGWIRISLDRDEDSQKAVFSVSNSGPGIPEESRAHIFERFYRVDKARNRSVDGIGLGLSISSEVIALLGSRLELKEANDQLTVFEVQLEPVVD